MFTFLLHALFLIQLLKKNIQMQICPPLVDKNVVSISFANCEFIGAGCALIRKEGCSDTQMWLERDL